MVKAKVFVYANRFDGFPKESDIQLVEEELPPLKDGEFLAEAEYLSVDPYMRGYAPALKLGTTFIGGQIAKVIESKNANFPVDKYVFGSFGWRSHTISNASSLSKGRVDIPPHVLPDFKGLSPSLGLGVLGMPGNTAYFGFLELCQPKPGNTVVITGAAGAVGTHVGQIAKLKDCKVIGIAGSDDKGKWLKEELNFDHFINYKTENIRESLKEVAPKGVDCYFDNVGGEISSTILGQMNRFGRISVCGAISAYNDNKPTKASIVQGHMALKELKMEGFIVTRWADRWMEGINQNMQWVQEGKIKYRETITDGFENMFKAFTDMLKGVNYGKAIVRAKALVK
ncbi:prostaglandin reductase 1-like [Anthonomus grandis grandis]|uniref:prostaglandin reductase 1-like n=1 Tax=Anthonomus grandis grandis TaxID=2921223 RepID=UPI0021662E67|nr:prostaglandin reductase 1-like [Anthonomus grandis grandis]